MKFAIKSGQAISQRSGCAIVGVYKENRLSPSASAFNQASGETINRVLESGDMTGEVGTTLLLHNIGGIGSERVLLVGCGKEGETDERTFRKIARAAATALKGLNCKDALCLLTDLSVPDRDSHWLGRQLIEAFAASEYLFTQMRGSAARKEMKKPVLQRVTLWANKRSDNDRLKRAISEGEAIASGSALSRDLANLPGNVCTPTYLAKQGQLLARQHPNIKTTILDEKAMEKLGMGSLLSVSRGSRQPAKLIIMEYSGAPNGKKESPIALVGKGLTFDAGGISLKPSPAMDEMKYDMCGGASVFGTIKAVAEMALPINVVAIVPSSENLPDGAANKPGDIVTSMSGQTIEILNTDAEGRLILCDALTYAARFKPSAVIDIATLTGACVVALGSHACGLLGNDDPLAEQLLAAGQESGDRAWRLPLWTEYDEQLKSPFADMANIGGKEAGTITAACFLSRYTKGFKWAHLDIAGTAWVGGENKGATGRPVPLLTQYLINQAAGK